MSQEGNIATRLRQRKGLEGQPRDGHCSSHSRLEDKEEEMNDI
jgi:hypothetical protein